MLGVDHLLRLGGRKFGDLWPEAFGTAQVVHGRPGKDGCPSGKSGHQRGISGDVYAGAPDEVACSIHDASP